MDIRQQKRKKEKDGVLDYRPVEVYSNFINWILKPIIHAYLLWQKRKIINREREREILQVTSVIQIIDWINLKFQERKSLVWSVFVL